MRPEIKIVEGRVFKPGLREVIVGRGAQKEFQNLEIGDKVPLRNSQWEVVGVFESGGDVNESRVIADESTLLSAYGRTAASSVTVLLTSEGAFDEFKEALTTNPTLSVSVERENEYYLRQSKNATTFFGFVATFVGGVMALGALFARAQHDVLGRQHARGRDRDAARDRLRGDRRRGLGARRVARARVARGT